MKPLYSLLLTLAFSPVAAAALLSPADRDSIEQQQQQLLRQNQQQRESLEQAIPIPDCSDQQKLATALAFFQNYRSDYRDTYNCISSAFINAEF